MRFTNVNFFDERRLFSFGDVETESGIIRFVRKKSLSPKTGADFLIPGLIDLHLHGCAGADFCEEETALFSMARALFAKGVTSFCPATMALPEESLLKACRNAARFASLTPDGCAKLRGVTLEGPFLNPKKCGAQDPQFCRAPDLALFERLFDASKGLIQTVCVSPELTNALPFIRSIHAKGITVSLAHTVCTYEQALAAFDAGARNVTHLFNAMEPLHHRAPGVPGAVFDRKDVTAELIGDGIHVHPAVVRMAFSLLDGRLCLISDAMAACGLSDGAYRLGGQRVTVQNGCARLSDGSIAGSTKDLFDAMRTVIQMGVAPANAVAACTAVPAKRLGLSDRMGVIAPGYDGTLVLLSSKWERKAVLQ